MKRQIMLSAITAGFVDSFKNIFKINEKNDNKIDINFFPNLCKNIAQNMNLKGSKTGARGISQMKNTTFTKKTKMYNAVNNANSLKKMCEKENKVLFV